MRTMCFGLVTILAIAAPVSAAPLVISNITGGWQNADPTVNATITNAADQGTDFVRWGGTGDPNTDSGYSFNPTDNPVGYVLGTPFALGVFTHFNQPIPVGSSITSVDYSFGFSTNGTPSSLADVFHFDHNETPNVEPCPTPSGNNPCDDIVTISAVTLNSLIQVGTDQFFFNLLGFSTDGGATIGSQFLSPEGGSNSATLYGVVTSQPLVVGAVPEPASLVLMGSGLILLATRLRKRSR